MKNANPEQILNALLDFKREIDDQVPGRIVVCSMPTKRLGRIIEALNNISNIGLETITNSNTSIGDIGRKRLRLNARGTNKLMHRFVSKLNRL